ncbi:thioesterase family protein [Salinisphaera sp. SWV1]|uniref:thioesterase family protein n=1 Tax=Salinisphaera sp. SWV1 TaxID=3454139 RepID=UPI003F86A892
MARPAPYREHHFNPLPIPMPQPDPASVFRRVGDRIEPTGLARGPWHPNAQHGGAPAGLLAQTAAEAVNDDAFVLQRLTLDIRKPVPIEPLTVTCARYSGRSTQRVRLELIHDGQPLCVAHVLFGRSDAIGDWQADAPTVRLTPVADSTPDDVHIPGTDPGAETFHYRALESRLAAGSVEDQGPAAAWFRFRYPLTGDNEPALSAQAVAIADLGNGISWSVPLEDYSFASTDLTVNLWRRPATAWIGVDSGTHISALGHGCTLSDLYDEDGRIGVASQTLLIRKR